ncbi:hypothetical protein [Stenotrophobium rhamnosiphilum]|uniref:DNA polymerase III alpha subunit finger domain-containing protein n=1 Tax=Stenotrophobium rhamnosiphilum TaxID=2029166 RepID=A0A2T5MBM8_9GAMM|nr:hypothetical protein [Stenotrophobium rhamnosiphilum]PTU29151.1 hypothetical protein CJD38_17535 [Stenotrophobium rhamnosiphilum]
MDTCNTLLNITSAKIVDEMPRLGALSPAVPERIDAISEVWGWRIIFREPSPQLIEACIQKGWHDRDCEHFESTFEASHREYDCHGKCQARIQQWRPRTMFEMAFFIAISDGWGGQSIATELIRRRNGAPWQLPDPDAGEILSCTYGVLIFREQFDALIALCTGSNDPGYAHMLYKVLSNTAGNVQQDPIEDLREIIQVSRLPLFEYILKACRRDRVHLNLPPLFRTAQESYDLIRAVEISPYQELYGRLKGARFT